MALAMRKLDDDDVEVLVHESDKFEMDLTFLGIIALEDELQS